MAEIPSMPRTQKETVTAIWYTLHNGMSAQIRETHAMAKETAGRVEKIEKKLPDLWTRKDHQESHSAYVAEHDAEEAAKIEVASEAEDKTERRKMSRRDVLMLVLVGLGIIVPPLLGRIL